MSAYRYEFPPDIPFEEVEGSLLLAVFAVEGLHGEAQTLLDARHEIDVVTRTCVIDADTPVGRDLNRLFATFLRREFGDQQFHVERETLEPAVAA